MHGVMEEANGSDHSRCLYIVWVMKTGRLSTHNTKHIHNTTIPLEQYLCEQIKKAAGRLEDIFIQMIPAEPVRPLTLHTPSSRVEATQSKGSVIREKEEMNSTPPPKGD